MLVRSTNEKNYYLKYSKILSKIISTAKKLYYNNKIIHAHNKIKATWKVINQDMRVNNGKKKERDEKINCENYYLKINAENFNDHFINIAKIFLIKLRVMIVLVIMSLLIPHLACSKFVSLSMITSYFKILLQVKLKQS
jgi:ABC-type multidrug transport system fused ATPase/permease subunit